MHETGRNFCWLKSAFRMAEIQLDRPSSPRLTNELNFGREQARTRSFTDQIKKARESNIRNEDGEA